MDNFFFRSPHPGREKCPGIHLHTLSVVGLLRKPQPLPVTGEVYDSVLSLRHMTKAVGLCGQGYLLGVYNGSYTQQANESAASKS